MNVTVEPSFPRSSVIAWIVLPASVVVLYFLLWWLAPWVFFTFVASEQGLVELATACFFGGAAFVALRLCVAAELPPPYRILYGLFAAVALFVALEEISYGQHLFRWTSPEFFQQYNQQGEMNLHNLMGSRPSKRLHLAADLGTAAGFVLLPLVLMLARRRRGISAAHMPALVRKVFADAYVPGTWTYYLVPGLQLVGLVVLARLVGWLKKVPGAGVDHNELRELLWSWAAFGYIAVIRKRLTGEHS
jgi:hypothetical protein